ncbi:MAG TPA: PEP-CTERM sorting domain-containing protein [Candidatus Acidoferrum sp.]|nr:PEP-CTERM sorting domain-containing protein [Candidatus Acidoferrum sp.]
MKLLLMVLTLALSIAGVHAQGLVLFNNRVTEVGLDAPALFLASGEMLDGGQGWRAALYGAVGTLSSDSSFVLLTSPLSGNSWVAFRTGAAAGYVDVGSDGARTIPGAGYNTLVTLQIRVWQGGYTSYEAATASGAPVGKSQLLTIESGPDDQNPRPMIGLQWPIPEPSTYVLASMGIAALLLLRSRSRV